ncbi:hypothetical protein OG205_07120 [Lentzea sp. NBC_00516]|nr:hypothetical protein [Lentzea sp. NBC_00516]WUD26758.1 hypothetical protein OG205_07120 [Lentzea sp. NBC_00516]
MISGPISVDVEPTPLRGLRPPATGPAIAVLPLNPPSPAKAAVTQHA